MYRRAVIPALTLSSIGLFLTLMITAGCSPRPGTNLSSMEVGESLTVRLPIAPHLRELSTSEYEEQLRDWAVFATVTKLNATPKQVAYATAELRPVRLPYIKELSRGYSRRVYLEDRVMWFLDQEDPNVETTLRQQSIRLQDEMSELPAHVEIYLFKHLRNDGAFRVERFTDLPTGALFSSSGDRKLLLAGLPPPQPQLAPLLAVKPSAASIEARRGLRWRSRSGHDTHSPPPRASYTPVRGSARSAGSAGSARSAGSAYRPPQIRTQAVQGMALHVALNASLGTSYSGAAGEMAVRWGNGPDAISTLHVRAEAQRVSLKLESGAAELRRTDQHPPARAMAEADRLASEGELEVAAAFFEGAALQATSNDADRARLLILQLTRGQLTDALGGLEEIAKGKGTLEISQELRSGMRRAFERHNKQVAHAVDGALFSNKALPKIGVADGRLGTAREVSLPRMQAARRLRPSEAIALDAPIFIDVRLRSVREAFLANHSAAAANWHQVPNVQVDQLLDNELGERPDFLLLPNEEVVSRLETPNVARQESRAEPRRQFKPETTAKQLVLNSDEESEFSAPRDATRPLAESPLRQGALPLYIVRPCDGEKRTSRTDDDCQSTP